MAGGSGRQAKQALAALLAAAVMTFALPAPVAAQGIFDLFFGGLRHAFQQRRPLTAYAEPEAERYGAPRLRQPQERRAEAAPHSGYCVRTCDGRYFPVRAHGKISAAEMCHAFCPGSETRLYSGGNIDYAAARDGSRYRDLDTAYVYRQQLVAGCTCNGHDPFGLAHVDIDGDPTLRPGDVVATKNGLMAFTGRNKDKVADFTPVQSDPALSKSYRDKLSELKIMPPHAAARKQAPVTLPLAANASHDERRRARLDR